MSNATGKRYRVTVHTGSGKEYNIDLTEEEMQTMTVKQLKVKIAKKVPQSPDQVMDKFWLYFEGQHLEDARLLSSYGIDSDCSVHMSLPGGGQRQYRLVVRGLRGEEYVMDLTEEEMHTMTVKQLKDKIAEKLTQSQKQAKVELRLIYARGELQDKSLLLSYHIRSGRTILMLMRLPGGGLWLDCTVDGLYHLVVRGLRGEEYVIDLTEEEMQTMKVKQFRDKIAEKLPPNYEQTEGQFWLTFADKQLEDTSSLWLYGIDSGSTVHMVRRLPGVWVPVRGLKGEEYVIDLTEEEMQTMTVKQLKDKIAEKLPPFFEQLVGEFRLVFAGKQLEDMISLSSYKISSESTIHMGLRLRGGALWPGLTPPSPPPRSASLQRLMDF